VKESTDGGLGVCKVLSSNPRTVRRKRVLMERRLVRGYEKEKRSYVI
jgi:hypothetical protein